jgi:chromosome segregation ATPase
MPHHASETTSRRDAESRSAAAAGAGVDDEKRRLVQSLEAARDGGEESAPDWRQALRRLEWRCGEDAEARRCLQALQEQAGEAERLGRRLAGAEATCEELEGTVADFEQKLLDAIAENGGLHERLEASRLRTLELRSAVVDLTRQRDGLRALAERLQEHGDAHLRALAAAEQEMAFLNDRLQRG